MSDKDKDKDKEKNLGSHQKESQHGKPESQVSSKEATQNGKSESPKGSSPAKGSENGEVNSSLSSPKSTVCFEYDGKETEAQADKFNKMEQNKGGSSSYGAITHFDAKSQIDKKVDHQKQDSVKQEHKNPEDDSKTLLSREAQRIKATLLKKEYTLLDKIGCGQYAKVYRVK